MEKEIILLKEGGEGYYEEKRSRFLAAAYPVTEEAEALSYLEAARKKYWDARHNCYAFVIGDNNELTRCSDDGEPSGTAGKPILEVILGKGLHNCLIIVTRYFGGTLLGTGGLARAYQKAAAKAAANSVFVKKIKGSHIRITADYNSAGRIQYAAGKNNYIIEEIQYGAQVMLTLSVPAEHTRTAVKTVTELTAGRAEIELEENCDIFMELQDGGKGQASE